MIRLLKSRCLWASIAAGGLVAALLWYLFPFQLGVARAHIDYACGRSEVKVYGGFFLSESHQKEYEEYVRLLRERYDVRVNHIADCVISRELRLYADGYNSVSRAMIAQKHSGLDVFRECWRQAGKRRPDPDP